MASSPEVRTQSCTKTCSVCQQNQPLSAFSRHRGRRDGLASRCRLCNARMGKAWYRRKQAETGHLYSTYVAMKQRCHNPGHEHFALYGGRGIEVCPEWRACFDSFRAWAVVNGYRPDLQIDRIDNDRGYEPGNCRFVTVAENHRNKRRRTRCIRTNPKLTPQLVSEIKLLLNDGIPQREIGRRFGVSHATIGAINTGRTWTEIA